MSHPQNTTFLEDINEKLGTAVEANDREAIKLIYTTLRSQGFDAEAETISGEFGFVKEI